MPFKKGQSGNPNGRPKRSGDKLPRVREIMDKHLTEEWWEDFIKKATVFEKMKEVARLRVQLEPKEREVEGKIRTKLEIIVQDEVG